MNTFAPYLIAAGALSLLLALMVGLSLWVQRQRQSDAGRIKVFFGLLWFLLFAVVAWGASLIIFGGGSLTSATDVLLPLAGILLVATSIAYQIRQCQRRLKHKW